MWRKKEKKREVTKSARIICLVYAILCDGEKNVENVSGNACMRKSFYINASNTRVYNIKIIRIFLFDLSSSNASRAPNALLFSFTPADYLTLCFPTQIFAFLAHWTPEYFTRIPSLEKKQTRQQDNNSDRIDITGSDINVVI